MARILITGRGGFVAHHLLEHVLATTGWDVVAPTASGTWQD